MIEKMCHHNNVTVVNMIEKMCHHNAVTGAADVTVEILDLIFLAEDKGVGAVEAGCLLFHLPGECVSVRANVSACVRVRACACVCVCVHTQTHMI